MNNLNTRRPVACTACHHSKVRCVQKDPDQPCERCLKANRECVIDPKQLRKRQRLASSKETERLEEKVRLLTEEIQRQQRTIQSLQNITNISSEKNVNTTVKPFNKSIEESSKVFNSNHIKGDQKDDSDSSSATVEAYNRPQVKQFLNADANQQQAHASYLLNFQNKRELLSELKAINSINLKRYYNVSANFSSIGKQRDELLKVDYMSETDVVAQKLLTHEEVIFRLRKYMTNMYTKVPVVSLFEEMEVPEDAVTDDFDYETFRKKRPFLFITILAITSIGIPKELKSHSHLNLQLTIKATEIVSHEVLIVGTKSLELLQCLLLLCTWYDSGELFQHRRYHLMNNLCVAMSQDLGLNGKMGYYYNKNDNTVKKVPLTDFSQSIISRKLALTVYISNISYSMFLKRETAVRWTTYLEDCYEKLINYQGYSKENYHSLAIFAKLHHHFERISNTLHHSESDPFNIDDSRTRFIITDLYNSLLKVKKSIPDDDYCTLTYYYSIEAYLLEPSLHRVLLTSAENDSLKRNFDPNSIKLSNYMVSLISNCAESCTKGINCYLRLSVEEIATLPLIVQARVFYICGMLIRLRCLSLLGPKHSELFFLPDKLLSQIRDVLSLNYKVSIEFPFNYFLPKTRVVSVLALQTYLIQIKETLEARFGINGENIENFDNDEFFQDRLSVDSEILGNPNLNPSELRALTYSKLWPNNNPNETELSTDKKPTTDDVPMINPTQGLIASTGASSIAYPLPKANNITPTTLKDLYNDTFFNTNPATATMTVIDSSATNTNSTTTPTGNNPPSTNNINVLDFLFDNNDTSSSLKMNQNSNLGSGFGNANQQVNINSNNSNSMDFAPPDNNTFIPQQDPASYWAFEENIWNDLLMGMDFSGNNNIGSMPNINNFYNNDSNPANNNNLAANNNLGNDSTNENNQAFQNNLWGK